MNFLNHEPHLAPEGVLSASIWPATQERAYRPDIDGLRAIAVLSVVLYHAGVSFFSGGFTGVDIFFVISGYLIGGHIFAEVRSNTFSFARFYQRRARRILPAFYFVVSFFLLAALVVLSPSEALNFSRWAVASILSVLNIYLRSGYFRTANEFNPLLMAWSLSVEEQFYAVVPVLLICLGRTRRLVLPALIFICGVSFIFSWYELGSSPYIAFYWLPARAWELGVGVVLSIAEMSRNRRILPDQWAPAGSMIGLALILAPFHLLTSATPFPGPAAVPSVLGTALLISTPASWTNRGILSVSPVRFIGRISYSWYLWHWPLLVFLRIVAGGVMSPDGVACVIAISFVAAVFSYKFVEQPFRKSSLAPGPLLLRYAAVSLVLLALCSTVWVRRGFPQRNPALAHEGEETLQGPCIADYGVDKPDRSPQCYASPDPRPSVALWGDSHSEALAPALRQTAAGAGYNLVQFSKGACLPLEGAALFIRDHPMAANECMHFNDEVLRIIATDNHIRLVIIAGRWVDPFLDSGRSYPLVPALENVRGFAPLNSAGTIFGRSLSASIVHLRSAGKQVIVFDDVPSFDFDPVLRFRDARIPARRALARWIGADTENSGLSSLAAAEMATARLKQVTGNISGVELINLKRRFCSDDGRCVFTKDGQLLYQDDNHLTAYGARYALQDFRFPVL